VANSSSKNVSVIDTATNTVVATVPVGDNPAAFGIFIAQGSVSVTVPTLSEWGMILLVLSLLTLGTWELAGRPALVGVATLGGGVAVRIPSRRLLHSVLVGQAIAGLGVVLYGVLNEAPAVPDALGPVLAGALLGVLVECCRRSRERTVNPKSRVR